MAFPRGALVGGRKQPWGWGWAVGSGPRGSAPPQPVLRPHRKWPWGPHMGKQHPSQAGCVGGGGRCFLRKWEPSPAWAGVSNEAAYSSNAGKGGVQPVPPHPAPPEPWAAHGHKGTRGTVSPGTSLAGGSAGTVHRGLLFLPLRPCFKSLRGLVPRAEDRGWQAARDLGMRSCQPPPPQKI